MQPPISDNFPFLAEHIHGVRPILRSYLARAEQYHDDGDHAELEEDDDDHRELEDAHAADAESPMATTSSTVSRKPRTRQRPSQAATAEPSVVVPQASITPATPSPSTHDER